MFGINGFQGYGHIILNIIRAINVVGLLAAASACGIVVAKTTDRGGAWWFFDTASFVFSALICLFLIVSEVPIVDVVRCYFRDNWPVLSSNHGLSWLAIIMIIVSVHVIGAPYNEKRDLKGPFGAAILAGGFLCFTTAIITLIGSMIFADRNNGINARNIRSDGTLASSSASSASSNLPMAVDDYAHHGNPVRSNSARNDSTRNDSTHNDDSTRNDSTRNDSTRNDSTRNDSTRNDLPSTGFPGATILRRDPDGSSLNRNDSTRSNSSQGSSPAPPPPPPSSSPLPFVFSATTNKRRNKRSPSIAEVISPQRVFGDEGKDSDNWIFGNIGLPTQFGQGFSPAPSYSTIPGSGGSSTSPIVPGLRRPDTAMHPMNFNTNAARYSEASYLNRF